jgi:hypothetical protein
MESNEFISLLEKAAVAAKDLNKERERLAHLRVDHPERMRITDEIDKFFTGPEGVAAKEFLSAIDTGIILVGDVQFRGKGIVRWGVTYDGNKDLGPDEIPIAGATIYNWKEVPLADLVDMIFVGRQHLGVGNTPKDFLFELRTRLENLARSYV